MTQQPIPVLDGRRAVNGDVVECISKFKAFDVPGSIFHPEWEEPIIGNRYMVVEKCVGPITGDPVLELKEFPVIREGRRVWTAANFVIIPPDTKAETKMEIETVKGKQNV